jgi:hypothetical protein
MPRDLSLILSDKEDIISYECNFPSKIIKILVGVGNTDKDGNFVVQPEQTYRYYSIVDEEFDNLIAANGSKPAGVFRKEDLWGPIDAKNIETRGKLGLNLNLAIEDIKAKK